jgi:hypothetical protein
VSESGAQTGAADAAAPRLAAAKWAADHAPFVVTAAAGLVVGARILRVAHGDANTSYELLRSVGTGTALLGLLLSALPAIAQLVGAYLIGASDRWFSVRHLNRMAFVAGIAPILIVFLTGLSAALLGALLVFHMGRGYYRRRHPRPSTGQTGWPVDLLVYLATAWTASLLLMSDRMWLPTESISIQGQDPVKAYVLTNDGEELRLLVDDDRSILVVAESDVINRFICSDTDIWNDTLVRLRRGPLYPACP